MHFFTSDGDEAPRRDLIIENLLKGGVIDSMLAQEKDSVNKDQCFGHWLKKHLNDVVGISLPI